MDIILVLLAGIADRIRGGFPDPLYFGDINKDGVVDKKDSPAWALNLRSFIKYVGYGAILAAIITNDFIIWPIVGVLWWVGSRLGYGNPWYAVIFEKPMGSDYQTWQIGPLRKSATLALIVRGALWGVPAALGMAIICYFTTIQWDENIVALVPAMAVAMPLSAWIARYTKGVLPTSETWFQLRNAWPWGEMFRGLICSGFLTVVV